MEKRDRYVNILLHRSSDTFVLLPGVCYMAGVGAAYGDPLVLTPKEQTPRQVGKQLIRLLKTCHDADIDAMAAHRTAGLWAYWRGEDVTVEDTHPSNESSERSGSRDAIAKRFPALAKGPAAIVRAFTWVQLVERDAWKSWKLTQQIKSHDRGSVTDGESVRIPRNKTATVLGTAVLDFFQSHP